MGKISQLSSKYIVQSSITIDGVVDRPDVVGAIFGQTEGLLGEDLELRDLQKSGRIGRIEVNLNTQGGKTSGEIIIPSSLDKAETAIIASALEVIERIGPCNSKIKVQKIEDVRISKRKAVIDRAKDLLRTLMDEVLPDSSELAGEVAEAVRVFEIGEYGKDRLAAGPAIKESDEIIVVEGRADVVNLLKHGFKNAIALNGASVPQTVIDLAKEKTVVVFVDGDRGGDLIISELLAVADIDFVTKAPDGKEVEEITKKEIHKALRSKITAEQAKLELKDLKEKMEKHKPMIGGKGAPKKGPQRSAPKSPAKTSTKPVRLKNPSPKEKETFNNLVEDLIGTKGAYVLDQKLNILGKVPITELQTTIKSLSSGVYAILVDGAVDRDLAEVAERVGVAFIIGMSTKVKSNKVNIMTVDALE